MVRLRADSGESRRQDYMQFGFKNSRPMLIAERNLEINTVYGESSYPDFGAWSSSRLSTS